VKPADISGIKRGNIWKTTFKKLAMNSKNKNIRDLYR
jgi:hypothetical protein